MAYAIHKPAFAYFGFNFPGSCVDAFASRKINLPIDRASLTMTIINTILIVTH